MTIESFAGNLEELEADLLVLILDSGQELFHFENEALQERLAKIKADFESKKLFREVSFDAQGLKVGTVVVYHTDLERHFGLWENVKIFTARGLKLGAETGRPRVAVALNTPAGAELIGKAVDGGLLGTYSFEKYRREPRKLFDEVQLVLWGTGSEAETKAIEEARILGEATNMARDLVNEPASVVTPAVLVGKASELHDLYGFKLDVWDQARLVADGCVGLVEVGAGAKNPPFMATLTHEGDGSSAHHLVLLGKGITFDTGGISIKPAEKMHLMRGDMAGAGAMQAIGQLKPGLKITGIVCCAENTPDANAMRPGDIIVYRNGKSVHIDNTDAEGRLVLADGLIQAGVLGATHVVDIATLTGASVRAVGPSFSALMGNNRSLVNAVTRAGGNQGESYWKLPLPAEYKEMLKHPTADLNNVGGPLAGASTAALFLQEFVPDKTAWAHLDIAPTFWREKPWKYFGEGPTGVGVRTFTDLALHWEEHLAK
jgi:leucyl aminopeptidase